MTILGMKMGSISFSPLFCSKRSYYVSFLKLVVVPVGVLAVLFGARLLFGDAVLNDEFLLSVFFAFAMPTAGLASTFADSYDGDTENAAAFTLGTTIHSIATIPVLYWLLCILL